MSDELRQVAERRCTGGSVGFTNASWIPGSVEGLLGDARLLADAYLGEHTWTKEPPTVPGWYWWRGEGAEAVVVRVDNLMARQTGKNKGQTLLIASKVKNTGGWLPSEMGGEWAGAGLTSPPG